MENSRLAVEHSARSNELIGIVKQAAQAETRRLKLLGRAKDAGSRAGMEKRFNLERKTDCQRISDLRQEAADFQRLSRSGQNNPKTYDAPNVIHERQMVRL